jgi:CRISPR system Cascade subunit CasE
MSTLWFTRATLKRRSPDVAPLLGTLLGERDSGSPLDTSHRLLWTLLPEAVQRAGEAGSGRAAFLWRRADDSAGGSVWYVLGPEPRSDCAFFHVESKPWEPAFAPGDRLAFDMVVNATVERMEDPLRGRDGRRRVDVVMDAMRAREREGVETPRARLRRECGQDALSGWLARQGERNGFHALDTELADYRTVPLQRGRGRTRAQLGISHLKGLVEVTDPDAFAARLASGFGRAKAFGCGLMLVRRAR